MGSKDENNTSGHEFCDSSKDDKRADVIFSDVLFFIKTLDEIFIDMVAYRPKDWSDKSKNIPRHLNSITEILNEDDFFLKRRSYTKFEIIVDIKIHFTSDSKFSRQINSRLYSVADIFSEHSAFAH